MRGRIFWISKKTFGDFGTPVQGGGTSVVKNDQTFSEMHTLAVYREEKVTEEMAEMHKKRNTFGSLARAFMLCRQRSG